jgi:sugar phosphate isomerase/epimerase
MDWRYCLLPASNFKYECLGGKFIENAARGFGGRQTDATVRGERTPGFPLEDASMNRSNRREFFGDAARAGATLGAALAGAARPVEAASRKMTIALTPGSIGVKANQREAIELAARHGFESVEPYARELVEMSRDEIEGIRDNLKKKKIAWAAAALTVEFRRDDKAFKDGMKAFPKQVRALERAGVERIGTWLPPRHEELSYMANFKQTARRLREAAKVAGDSGMRLGLEYVGTKTLWTAAKYPFIHTMAETKDLIAEIGLPNAGFVLDSWHWWTAGDSVDDLLSLKNKDVVSCDLNDAPKGIPVEQQIDNKRELPMATGVIDVKAFLNALQKIGYDGPVRAEPFNAVLNDMENEEACRTTVSAMKKAFALIEK